MALDLILRIAKHNFVAIRSAVLEQKMTLKVAIFGNFPEIVSSAPIDGQPDVTM